MSNIFFGLYTASILLYNLCEIKYLFYLTFFYVFLTRIKKYNRTHNDYYLIELIIYSVIIPSNYIILISLVTILVFKLRKLKKVTKKTNDLFIILFIAYLILNTIYNKVSPINLLFYILYVIPVPICALAFNKFELGVLERNKLIELLKKALIIQGIGIVSELIFHLETILSMIDFDWVTGTFGKYQGNIFFFFSAFCFIIFLNQYMCCRRELKYLILSGIYMIMTGSIALIILFATSIVIYFFVTSNIRTSIRMKIIALLSAAICFFVLVTPAWIKNYIVEMATADDKSIYISKISDYENVFFNKDNSVEFELLGRGIGEYSSRAALTCTGIYLDAYNSLFEPSMSEYTRKYIYGKLLYVYEHELGIVDTPFSEYISIKGELGFVGLMFFILYGVSLLKRNKGWPRIFTIFILMACFTENYMEFAKIVSILYIIVNEQICDRSFQIKV